MKKMILMAAIMLSSVSAFAQNEVGQFTLQPKVGINFANLTGDGTKGKVGFAGGLEAEYGVAENFSLTLGAIFSMEGCKFEKVADKSPKLNLNYINVPVMLQYYIVPGLAIKMVFSLASTLARSYNNSSLNFHITCVNFPSN